MFGIDKGRGLFRFDNDLSEDMDFVEAVRHEIQRARDERGIYADVTNLGLRLEMVTSGIRVLSIKRTSQKGKERSERRLD